MLETIPQSSRTVQTAHWLPAQTVETISPAARHTPSLALGISLW